MLTVEDPLAPFDDHVQRVRAIPFWAYPQLRMAAPSFRSARSAIDRWRPTLVHAATPFGVGIGARAAARQLGVPLVTSYHTHFTAYLEHYGLSALNAISWPFLRWFHNGGLATFAPSETVRRELALNGFRGTRVWSRGVDAWRFHPRHRSRAVRGSLGVREDQIVVLYVGRLAPEKGIDVALQGVALAMEARPRDIALVLTGDGPAEARLRRTAPRGTIFTGPLTGERLSAMYASADVLVFPSLTETFGNVVLEGMASGLAIIAPDRGPTTEFAGEGIALTCDVTDPRAIASALHQLVTDAEGRERFANAALTAARSRTWDAVFDRLIEDYRACAPATIGATTR